MQGSVFILTAGGFHVSSFTGTGTEFINVSSGLSKVWQMANKEFTGSPQELVNLMYISTTGSLTAKLANQSIPTIYGVRFHGELSSLDAGTQLVECIRQAVA